MTTVKLISRKSLGARKAKKPPHRTATFPPHHNSKSSSPKPSKKTNSYRHIVNKMPKRKLSDLTTSTPKKTTPNPPSKPRNEQEYAQIKLQTTRLRQKFEFGVNTLSRALKAARGFERQKLGRRQKEAKAPEAENGNVNVKSKAKGKDKGKAKSKLSTEENARRIEGEIAVLKVRFLQIFTSGKEGKTDLDVTGSRSNRHSTKVPL